VTTYSSSFADQRIRVTIKKITILLGHEVFDVIKLKNAMQSNSVQRQVCFVASHNNYLGSNRDSMAMLSIKLRRRADVHNSSLIRQSPITPFAGMLCTVPNSSNRLLGRLKSLGCRT